MSQTRRTVLEIRYAHKRPQNAQGCLKGLCQLGHMRSRVRSSLICIQLTPGVLLFRHFYPSSRSLVLTRRETFSLACFLELMETDIAVAESGSNVVSLADCCHCFIFFCCLCSLYRQCHIGDVNNHCYLCLAGQW